MKTPEQFWSHVHKTETCWPYSTSYSYGTVLWEGRMMAAHRVAWTITNGPIPEGMLVLHRCDFPPCVRPDHLFLGTQRDNANDYYAKAAAGLHRRKCRVYGKPHLWEEWG